MGDENGNEARVTRRVVLKRERVLRLPDALTQTQLDALLAAVAAVKVAGLPKGISQPSEAWTVIGVFDGASKEKAIEAHAGKPGTPDAKPGVYKAPGVTAWNGGSVYEAPPAPLVERKPLEDALT